MKSFICVFMLHIAFVSAVYAQESPVEALTPTETVKLFEACYGTAEMDTCAEIVTVGFRNNKPKSVWVYDTWKALNKAQYRKESSEVLRQKIDGDTAYVILQTRIDTAGGFADQKEMYTLLKVDGVWLIHDLRIGDEFLEEEQQQL